MATDFADIQNGVIFIWSFIGSEFSLPTQYEGQRYTPVIGTPWARLTLVPADTSVATLSSIGEDEHNGVLLIDLFYPANNGNGLAMIKADEIRSVFKANVYGDSGGATIYVKSCSRSGGFVEDNWYRLTLSVEWTARTTRD